MVTVVCEYVERVEKDVEQGGEEGEIRKRSENDNVENKIEMKE